MIAHFFFPVAQAATFTPINISSNIPGNYATSSGPTAAVANFYQFALIAGGVLAFAMIVWGGIRYTASAGDHHSQGEAKEIITAALWGLLLLVGAYLVLNVINPQLLNFNLPALPTPTIQAPATGSTATTATGGSTTAAPGTSAPVSSSGSGSTPTTPPSNGYSGPTCDPATCESQHSVNWSCVPVNPTGSVCMRGG